MKNLNKYIALGVFSAVFAASNQAAASGFQLSEASITNMGRAFAGSGVAGDDLSASFFNPAGMSLIKTRGAQVGLTYVSVSSEFSGDRSFQLDALGGVLDKQGITETGDIKAFVPSFFFVTPINNKLTLGLSLTVPFGLGTEYDKTSDVNFFAVDSELRMMQFDATLAYKINDNLSIGASFGIQEGYALLSNININVDPNPANQTLTELEGDDLRAAFNFGVMYEFNKDHRIGLAFRPSTHHKLEGEINSATDIKAELRTPELITFSTYNKVHDDWAISTQLKWTNWSRFKELNIKKKSDGSTLSLVHEKWEDTFMLSLGVDYFLNKAWTLRGGIAFDETPIPSSEYRTARIPDNNRVFLSAGASYKPNDAFQFDFGYTMFIIADSAVKNTHTLAPGVSQTLDGEYSSKGIASLVGLSAQYRF